MSGLPAHPVNSHQLADLQDDVAEIETRISTLEDEIEKQACLQREYDRGVSAIQVDHLEAMRSVVRQLEAFLSREEDQQSKEVYLRALLSVCLQYGAYSCAEFLLASYNGDIFRARVFGRSDNASVVEVACEDGYPEMVLLLLARGMDPRPTPQAQQETRSCLFYAVRTRLFSNQEEEGYTPDHDEVMRLLLEDGRVDVNEQDRHRRTPLHHAVQHGHMRRVQLLLEHGADYTKRDDTGRMPIELTGVPVCRRLLEVSRVTTRKYWPSTAWARTRMIISLVFLC